MIESNGPVEIKLSIQASPQQVYNAFTNSVAVESWLSNTASVDLQEGGRFYLWWNDNRWYSAGKVTKVEEHKTIQFDWHGVDEPVKSEVKVDIEAVDSGTLLTLTHRCDQPGVVGKEHRDGWEHFLGNLKSLLETGRDLRLFSRPMLGIFIGAPVDESTAERLSLPQAKGILISGTVEGMGAEAAGIQANDVIVSMNEHELNAFSDFPTALGGKKAGDDVSVVLFRGPETIETTMALSTRPDPVGLADRDAYADDMQTEYADVDRQLDELFTGVTEEQASAHPAEGEWNAKEILCHMLYTEEWSQLAMAALINDLRPAGYVNADSLICTMARRRTLEQLLSDLKTAEQVTIDVVRNLPDEFIKDKRKFGNLVMGYSPNNAAHTLTHFDQLKTALNKS